MLDMDPTIALRIATTKATTEPVTNAWPRIGENELKAFESDGDVDMSKEDKSPYRFLKGVYSETAIATYKICETPYGFSNKIRKPTRQESAIMRGLLEGTILCAQLLPFLK
ncbi:hypothetical protein L915_19627 [Phytophthora nicotianae]|uniref:Uncharacterized protein n=1 Tax=Phytophthora nicotianae TaxID=4792 RepID=W2FRQ1_PHYNI|nr:hypothetical protein L915_19627 [Phytophthora nicotianae]ETL26874.1 hypothetical protein L916_19517 [Phytophthora nicotianae]